MKIYRNVAKYGLIRAYFSLNGTEDGGITLHKVLSKPAPLCSSEKWNLTVQDCKIRFLRSLEKMTIRDRKKNSNKGRVKNNEFNRRN